MTVFAQPPRKGHGVDLSVENHQRGSRTVLTVTGEVDVYTAATLREQLLRHTSAENTHAVVDLSNVGFIDSTGIGVLVGALKRIRNAGGELELVIGRASTMKVFRITGLVEVFTIYDSLDQVPE